MNDTKKLILLLVGAVVLIAAAFWLITPLRGNNDLLSNMFTLGGSDTETVVQGPILSIDLTKAYSAVVTTTEGSFTIDLYANNAPFTVDNFVSLSNADFYDDSSFNRVIANFIIQAGQAKSGVVVPQTISDEINADSLGLDTITVGKAYWLSTIYNVNDSATADFSPENLSRYGSYTVKSFFHDILGYIYRTDVTSVKADPWCVGMANSGPNTASSQFFVITADAAQRHLDGRYTIFGKVTEGFDTLEAIENAGAGGSSIINVEIIEE